MAKIITISDLQIEEWTVNVQRRAVHVVYKTLTDAAELFDHGAATFWETVPDPSEFPNDDPTTWYQLPPAYNQLLTDLTVDARNALLHLINE